MDGIKKPSQHAVEAVIHFRSIQSKLSVRFWLQTTEVRIEQVFLKTGLFFVVGIAWCCDHVLNAFKSMLDQ